MQIAKMLLDLGADPFATNVVKKQSWALPLSSRQDNPCVARNPELAESSLHLHPSPPALAHLSSLRALALTCLAPVPWAPSRRQQGESALFVAIDDGAEESEAVITTHVKALAIKGSASKAAKQGATQTPGAGRRPVSPEEGPGQMTAIQEGIKAALTVFGQVVDETMQTQAAEQRAATQALEQKTAAEFQAVASRH